MFTRRAVLGLAAAAIAAPLLGGLPGLAAEDAPPAPPADETRIAFGSCLKRADGGLILDRVVARRPDIFLWLGDAIYADTEDMAVKRATYATLAANPRFQRLWQACPNHATWDDHDYGRDNAGDTYVARDASQREFCDFWQVPADDPRRRRAGVFTSIMHGVGERAVQVILLDGRYFRGTAADPRGTVLGAAQWEWLAQELRRPARLRLVCSGVQVLATPPDAAGLECWNQFPHERQRLFDLVRAERAEGVVFLSGDRHFAELSRLEKALGYDAWDLTSSSLDQMTWSTPNPLGVGPQVHLYNFGQVTIDWAKPDPAIRLEIVDGAGGVALSRTLARSELAFPA